MENTHELLAKMADSLNEDLIPAQLSEPEEAAGIEILSVYFDGLGMDHDPVLGEFFFSPGQSEEDRVLHFNAVLTLADEIDEERLPALYEAMSYINYRLPCGSYALDREHTYLVYKLVTPLSAELPGELLFAEMNVGAGNAVACCDLYMDTLLRLLEGELTIEDVTEELS